MQKTLKIILGTFAILGIAMIVSMYFGNNENMTTEDNATDRQQMIHEKGAQVMPFDLDKTQHIFKKTSKGGTETIVVRDAADTENLSLIRSHLQMEAQKFAQGNFADPSSLHGEGMPGLAVLEENAAKIDVKYSEVENGAKIDFATTDVDTIDAIHDWFDAQVTDHGDDATSE